MRNWKKISGKGRYGGSLCERFMDLETRVFQIGLDERHRNLVLEKGERQMIEVKLLRPLGCLQME